jgi:putative restriction endonuclease
VERDEDIRSSCFARLDLLRATFGDDLPYRTGLDGGFPFRGTRVPFLSPQKGIFRASAQRGPAALSINTSANSPYGDQELEDGFRYAYRAGDRALYPFFVTQDDPALRSVVVTPGLMVGSFDEPEAVPIENPLERRYAVRETRIRLHQGIFRGRVLVAYRDSCTICRLKELRLLDAAHIVGDTEPSGEPLVSNGLSLCSIHHRAFDQHLVGITPDYEVRVSRRLLDDEDGPMLELLKTFHGSPIALPSRRESRPDRDMLALRFERFKAA